MNETIRLNIFGCIVGFIINCIKKPAVGWNTYIYLSDGRIIGNKFSNVITGLVVYIGDGVFFFVNSNPSVCIPGLLNKKAIGVNLVNIVAKGYGIRDIIRSILPE